MSATATRTPDRTQQQRLDALQKANQIRAERAGLKRRIRAGMVRSAELIADPPEFTLTMKVHDVLIATPKLGRVKTGLLLRRLEISPSKTLDGLTPRQREVLAQALRSGRTR